MTEERIKELIQAYVNAEMELIPDPDTLPEHPAYSRRFNRKMKRMMRAGDYFGGNLRLYTAFRRAVAALLIIMSLAVANQASAAIFGFNPWKEVTRVFFPDVEMEQKTYEKKDVNTDNMVKPVSDVPTYVPEGYVEVDHQEGGMTIALEWQKLKAGDSVKGIAYARDTIDENAGYIEDVAYDKVQNTEIAGYHAKIGYKSDRISIEWMDEKYMYLIWTNDMEDGKDTIIRMSESIYKKN